MGVYYYSVESIGPWRGVGHMTGRLHINQAGMITGTLITRQDNKDAYHAVAIEDGNLTDLTPGGNYCSGRGSNDANPYRVAGRADGQKATVWTGGPNPTDLSPGLRTSTSEANDVNNGGVVAGTADGHAFTYNLTTNEIVHPLIPGADWSQAEAINNHGDVVGRGFLNLSGFWAHAFFRSKTYGLFSIWKDGFFGDAAWDVNDGGMVVGRAKSTYDFYFPFRYSGNIEQLGGGMKGSAEGINTQNDIVGYLNFGDGDRAALYIAGEDPAIDLNERIPPGSGWRLTTAQRINDDGLIVGWGEYNGTTRPFLLRPLDQKPPWGYEVPRLEALVREILLGGGGLGLLIPGGGLTYPKGPPVDPGGPFRQLNPEQRDVLVGLAVQVLASHINNPEARRLAEIGGLDAVRMAVDRLIQGRAPGSTNNER